MIVEVRTWDRARVVGITASCSIHVNAHGKQRLVFFIPDLTFEQANAAAQKIAAHFHGGAV